MMFSNTVNALLKKLMSPTRGSTVDGLELARVTSAWVSTWQELAWHLARTPESEQAQALRKNYANQRLPAFAARPTTLNELVDEQFLTRASCLMQLALNGNCDNSSVAATTVEVQLLLQSFALPDLNWETLLDDCAQRKHGRRSVDMTVFLLKSSVDGASTYGALARLKLWLLTSAHVSEVLSRTTFHRAPGSFLLPLDQSFRDSLKVIEASFDGTLRRLGCESSQIVWDLSMIDGEKATLWGVHGASASAAFALGAYHLLSSQVEDESVSVVLEDVDVTRVGVTAQVVRNVDSPWPRLAKVNGVAEKWFGLSDWTERLSRRRTLPSTLLVAPEQWHDMNEPHGVQAVPPANKDQPVDVRDLFRKAQDLTGEKIGVDTRALWLRLRETGQSGPGDDLLEHALEELQGTDPSRASDARSPPSGFVGYLLHRYALRASGRHIAFWIGKEAARRAAHSRVNIIVDPEWDAGDLAATSGEGLSMPRACESLSKLLALPKQPHAWVLTGAPGSGKTYLLADFEKERSLRLLCDETAGDATQADDNARYATAWFSLSDFNTDATDAQAELARIWAQSYPHYSFARFLSDVVGRRLSLVLIFDAINESKGATVQRIEMLRLLATWLTALARSQSKNAPPIHALFSVRTMESIRFSDAFLGFIERQAALQEWTREDSLQYVEQRMPRAMAARGTLLNALRDKRESVRAKAFVKLMSSPALLAAQCTLLETKLVTDIFDSDAKLLTALALVMLHIEFKKIDGPRNFPEPLFTADDLVALDEKSLPTMLQPRPLLPNDGLYIRWVEQLASSMQKAGERSTVMSWKASLEVGEIDNLSETDRKKARDLTARIGWIRKETRSASLPGSRTDDLLHWSHERWRELFAARALDASDIALGQYELPELDPPTQVEFADQILRGDTTINWRTPVGEQQESLLFLMDTMSVKRSENFIRALTSINPTLAARCALRVISKLEPHSSHQGWDKSAALEKKYGPSNATLKTLRAELLRRFTQPHLVPCDADNANAYEDIRHRHDWGLLLGELNGDARFELHEGLIDGNAVPYLRPKEAFICQIGEVGESSDYWIGETRNRQNRDNEGRLTRISVRGFRVSAFPLTNAEYRFFVEAGGYREEKWWATESATRWLKLFRSNPADMSQQEMDWHYAGRRNGLQPIIGITWFEANAYAAWVDALERSTLEAASQGAEERIRLLTEGEWRAAAGGLGKQYGPNPEMHRRQWPYAAGNGQESPDQDPLRINFAKSNLYQTSPVGLFARGRTPEGLEDMAGNAWEWTASAFTDELDANALVTAEDRANCAPDRIALAGGCGGDEAANCRATASDVLNPHDTSAYHSARVCGWRVPESNQERSIRRIERGPEKRSSAFWFLSTSWWHSDKLRKILNAVKWS